MATYLDRILESTRTRLAARQSHVPLAELCAQTSGLPPCLDFRAALQGDGYRIIAEIKRASPSKGPLRPDLDAKALARAYAANGAAALSVLTEESAFRGSYRDLDAAGKAASEIRPLPVLAKDFHIDPYQLYEARSHGADAVLLIAAILEASLLHELQALAKELGMAALVEVHDEADLEKALEAGASIIGINNRDLCTFHTALETTHRLRPLVPSGCVVVGESGIASHEDVRRLHQWGVDAVLVGEALVTAADPGARLRELLGVSVGG